MIEHVTIGRDSKDGLTNWKWRFYYSDHVLWLDWYCEFQRPTRRHNFRSIHSFSRTDNRDHDLKEDEVVLPADIMQEAVKKFCEEINVKRWSDRGKS